MLALGNLANKVSAVSSTVGSIKIVIGVIKEVSKQNVNKMENLGRKRTKSSLLLSSKNVAIALIWALHHMCFYYWVTCDTITQKNLCEKYVTEVQTYNQQRGAKKNLSSIRQIIDFQMVMLL